MRQHGRDAPNKATSPHSGSSHALQAMLCSAAPFSFILCLTHNRTLDTSGVTDYNSRSSFHKRKRAEDVEVTRLLYAHGSLQRALTRSAAEVAPRFGTEGKGATASWFYLSCAPHLC